MNEKELQTAIDTSIANIDRYVKDPTKVAPLDDEISNLHRKIEIKNAELQKMQSDGTSVSQEALDKYNLEIKRLNQKIAEYNAARASIQINARTELTKEDGNFISKLKGIVKEKLAIIEVNSVMSTMRFIQDEVNEEIRRSPEKASGLRGTTGWLLLSALEEAGYYPRIVTESLAGGSKKQSIRINTLKGSNPEKALAIENMLNGQFPSIREGLEYSLMWKSSQFDAFAESSLDKDGKINPSANLSYAKYMEDAKKRGIPLTESDRAFLDSVNQIPGASNPEYMSKAMAGYFQWRDGMRTIQAKFSQDPQAQAVLEKITRQVSDKSVGVTTGAPSSYVTPSRFIDTKEEGSRMTAKLFSGADGSTGRSTGDFINRLVKGSFGGAIGGAGDILKLGGGDPVVTLILGGGLMYGLYKTFKKFGFFGGLGVILGFGAANNMEHIFGKGTPSTSGVKSAAPGTPSEEPKAPKAPTNTTTSTTDTALPATTGGSTPETKGAPDTSWKATLLGLLPTAAADTVETKWNSVSQFFGAKYADLKNVLGLKSGTPEQLKAWEDLKKKLGYEKFTTEKKKEFDTFLSNQDSMNTLNTYVKELDVTAGIKKLRETDPAKYATLSLQETTEAARVHVEKKEQSKTNGTTPANGTQEVKDIYTLSEGHGDLWLVLKMISSGYIPTILAAPEKGVLRLPYYMGGATYNPLNVLWHKTDALYSPAKWNTETKKYIDGLLGDAVKKETAAMVTPELKAQTGTDMHVKYTTELEKITALDTLLKSGKGPGTPEFDKAYKEYMHAVETGKIRIIKNQFTSKEKNVASELERITKAEAEVAKVATEIDTHAKTVTDAADKWKSDKTDANKKALLDAMDDYHKKVAPLEQHGVNNAAILGEKEWKEIIKKSPAASGWASNFYKTNLPTIQKPIDWLKERPGKIAGHWTGRTFLGVGMLSLMVDAGARKDKDSEKGFVDLIQEGHGWTGVGKAMRTYGGDFALSMIPIVGVGHDIAMINSAQWRKIITGSDAALSEEEKYMRGAFAAVGVFGGAGVLIKYVGKGVSKLPVLGSITGGLIEATGTFMRVTSNIARGAMIWGGAGYGMHRLYTTMNPQ